MRHVGGGEQGKMSFLKQIMCRGTGCQGSGILGGGSALFPAGHDGGRSWSAEGGLPRQTGECCASPPSGSAPAWSSSRAGAERAELPAREPAGRWVGAAPPAPGKGAAPGWCRCSPESCTNCSCPLPTRKLPRAGIPAEEGELAMGITQVLESQSACTPHTPLQGAAHGGRGATTGGWRDRRSFGLVR